MIPYAPRPQPDRIAELMLARGRALAEGKRQSGAIWGGTIAGIGRTIGDLITDIPKARALEAETKRRDQIAAQQLEAGRMSLDEAKRTAELGSEYRAARQSEAPESEVLKRFAGTPYEKQAAEAFGALRDRTRGVFGEAAARIRQAGDSPDAAVAAIDMLAEQGYDRQVLGQYLDRIKQDPRVVPLLVDQILGQSPDEAHRALVRKPEKLQGFAPGTAVVGDKGTAFQVPERPPTPQHVNTSKGIVWATPGETETSAPFAQAPPPASMIINPQRQETIEDTGRQLYLGNVLPADLSKRNIDYNAAMNEANKISLRETGKPWNLTKAKLDYQASLKHIVGMNGSQRQTFFALANSVVNTMDEAKRLSDELEQGGVQKFSQAKRSTILNVYGNTPQSETAAQYLAVINTLKEEYAMLAQGGYAPTEAAWKLANAQINADFGVKDFKAVLNESQRLINYRLRAFNELTPYTTEGRQPAAPAPGAATSILDKYGIK